MRTLMNPASVSFTFGAFILRVSFGLMMLLSHGVGKLEKLMDDPGKFADPIGVGATATLILAVFGEVLCSVFLTLGLFTRWAALFNATVMAVAAFIVHANDPFGKKEMAFIYLAAYVTIFMIGPGKWSIDHAVNGRKSRY